VKNLLLLNTTRLTDRGGVYLKVQTHRN